MAQTPPFRNRPKSQLEFARLTGSPSYPGQSDQTTSLLSTPQNIIAYSPFRSAGIRPPAQYEVPVQFAPKWTQKLKYYTRHSSFPIRRLLSSKPLWLVLMIGALSLWCFQGGRDELDLVKLRANGFGNELFREERTRNLQFFPAENPKIHAGTLVDVSKVAF